MTFLKKLTIGLVALAGLAATNASAQTVEQLKAQGVIKIGVMTDYPPYGMINAEGQPDGLDVDVARLLADRLGVTLELVPVLGVNRVPNLVSNQADVLVASLTITPERAERVDFSAPYATSEIGVYAAKDIDLPDASALAGKSISVARGNLQDGALTAVAPEGADIRRFDDGTIAIQAVLSGQADAIAASPAALESLNDAAPDKYEWKFSLSDPENQQFYGIAVRKGSEDFLAFINEFLVDIKASGELGTVYKKWIGQPIPEVVVQTNK